MIFFLFFIDVAVFVSSSSKNHQQMIWCNYMNFSANPYISYIINVDKFVFIYIEIDIQLNDFVT